MDRPSETAAIVRAADRDRYLADLYAPASLRPHLFALHAFDAEVARIPAMVSEPTLGEMRLAWWRTAIRGEHGGNPVAAAVALTIDACRLPLAAFDRLLDARVFDLYNDPMPDLGALEAYAGETASAMLQLSAIVLAEGSDPGTAEVAGYAGVALAIVQLLRNLPRDAARQRLYLPADMIRAAGADPTDIFAGRATPAVRAVVAMLRAVARERLAAAEGLLPAVAAKLRPAFLPLALVEPDLGAMERRGFDPLRDSPRLADWRRQWIILRAARSRV